LRTHRFRLGNELLEVTLTAQGDGRWSALVVRGIGEGRSARTIALDARRLGDAHWLARLVDDGGAMHDVRLEREAGDGSGRVARFGAAHVTMDWIDPFVSAGNGKGGHHAGPRKIASPMPGRVVSIPVAVGDSVEEGQPVVVVEAMKMANELRSPVAGRVKSIHAKPGDKVEAGAALVVVETA
jgi:biotin carboxyl carrier protein